MDISDLLPSSRELQKVKVEGFVHSTLARLAKDLGAHADILRQIKNNDTRYDVPMFMADFPNFPWGVVVDRVESYSVQDLFEAPTKSPVFMKFTEHFPDWAHPESKQLMFFKAKGFTVLVVGTIAAMKGCGTYLTAKTRNKMFYVTTYSEFVDAVRDLGVLEA